MISVDLVTYLICCQLIIQTKFQFIATFTIGWQVWTRYNMFESWKSLTCLVSNSKLWMAGLNSLQCVRVMEITHVLSFQFQIIHSRMSHVYENTAELTWKKWIYNLNINLFEHIYDLKSLGFEATRMQPAYSSQLVSTHFTLSCISPWCVL